MPPSVLTDSCLAAASWDVSVRPVEVGDGTGRQGGCWCGMADGGRDDGCWVTADRAARIIADCRMIPEAEVVKSDVARSAEA